MRDDQDAIDDDTHNNCFICCDSRDQFERLNIDFERHQEEDHNMDCYTWVKLYLVKKHVMEMNGIESYVYGYIKGKQIGYIPTNASFAL